jgi:hypothetical protein
MVNKGTNKPNSTLLHTNASGVRLAIVQFAETK